MEIRLVRHGESEGNTKAVDPQQAGDYNLNLSPEGKLEAVECGKKIGADYLHDAIVYNSPYYRTRQTLAGILEGAGITDQSQLSIYEDPRLREVEHGFHGTKDGVKEQRYLREIHGYFYYRYMGGESPADCFDRVATFLESMQRQMERKNKNKVLIVSHGITIRCFVMRFLHLTVEEFDTIKNPGNCEIIRIAELDNIPINQRNFSTGSWAVEGLRFWN